MRIQKRLITFWLLSLGPVSAQTLEHDSPEVALPVPPEAPAECEPPPINNFNAAPLDQRLAATAQLHKTIQEKIVMLKDMSDEKAAEVMALQAQAGKIHDHLSPEKVKKDKIVGGISLTGSALTTAVLVHFAAKYMSGEASAPGKLSPRAKALRIILGLGACGMAAGYYHASEWRQNSIRSQAIKDLEGIQKDIDNLTAELEVEKKAREGVKSLIDP